MHEGMHTYPTSRLLPRQMLISKPDWVAGRAPQSLTSSNSPAKLLQHRLRVSEPGRIDRSINTIRPADLLDPPRDILVVVKVDRLGSVFGADEIESVRDVVDTDYLAGTEDFRPLATERANGTLLSSVTHGP
jgi:hypothetical protein